MIEVASEEEWNSHLSAGGSFGGKAVVVDFSVSCGTKAGLLADENTYMG